MAKSTRGLLLIWLFAGCQLGGVAPPPPVEEGPREPVVARGPISDAEQREAAALYDQALASFEASRYPEALRIAADLVGRYPASEVSGAAVLLEARAEAALGAIERADAMAEQYIGLLEAGDPRAAEMRLFQAEVLVGQPMIQLDRLLRMGEDARQTDVQRATQSVRALADSLTLEELEIVAEGAPRGGAVAAPLYTRLAIELLASGEEDRAAEYASAALESGASGAELSLAEGVLRGELPDSLRPTRAFAVATILPHGGPPALAEYASLIAEGVEVAVATVLDDGYDVTVVARDDEADSLMAVEIVSELEAEPVAGMIGFLQDELLVAAAQARERGVPIVSPTARNAALAGDGVYSLEGPDYEGAEAIARYSASRAHQRVAIVQPATPIATEEADAFAAVARSLGIPIVGRFSYEAGTTTDLGTQLGAAQNALRAAEIAALGLTEDDTLHVDMLEPVGLFMPIPAEDVGFVAPQFAHHGLDTLAIERMGTSGWTDPQAFEEVDPRLMTGVVATAPVAAGPGSEGYERFRQAYEEHFQRSLVSSTPALGYDAALLMLEALRPGRTRPSDVRGALQGLAEIEGATGTFSIVDGRVRRLTQVVRIDRGQAVPIEPF